MFLSGFSRAYIAVLSLIMLHYFDAKSTKDKRLVNFWTAFVTMGDVTAIVFTTFLLKMQLNW